MKIVVKGLTKLLSGLVLLGCLLLIKATELLEKRLNSKETEAEQKQVTLLSAVQFAVCFCLAGIDFRCKWTAFPKWITVCSCIANVTLQQSLFQKR